MLKGIQYVTDTAGKPVAVQIDLRKHGALWEDFCDNWLAEARSKEEKVPLGDVKKSLKKLGKLK